MLENLSQLKPNPQNPRKISDRKLAMLKKSLEEFGDLSGIVYNRRSDQLVGGHQRHKILPPDAKIVREKVYDKPTDKGTVATGYVVIGSERFTFREVDWDDAKEKAANIAANNGAGEWDTEKLMAMLKDVQVANIDLELTMFPMEEAKKLLSPTRTKADEKADETPSAPREAKTKPGDIYVLGDHRLMCGDALDLKSVEKLMDGNKADLIFTDPPYNINYEGKTKEKLKIQNDALGASFPDFLRTAFSNYWAICKPGAGIYVCHADTERINFTKTFMEAGFHLSSVIIWVKNNATFGRQDYFWKHEPILYGWQDKGTHKFYGPTNETTVWEIDRPAKSEEHPTMKPIALIERALDNSSMKGDIVVDFFGGSGSTLIGCEKMNRRCFTLELDPIYCDVIVARWEKYTGKKAERL